MHARWYQARNKWILVLEPHGDRLRGESWVWARAMRGRSGAEGVKLVIVARRGATCWRRAADEIAIGDRRPTRTVVAADVTTQEGRDAILRRLPHSRIFSSTMPAVRRRRFPQIASAATGSRRSTPTCWRRSRTDRGRRIDGMIARQFGRIVNVHLACREGAGRHARDCRTARAPASPALSRDLARAQLPSTM